MKNIAFFIQNKVESIFKIICNTYPVKGGGLAGKLLLLLTLWYQLLCVFEIWTIFFLLISLFLLIKGRSIFPPDFRVCSFWLDLGSFPPNRQSLAAPPCFRHMTWSLPAWLRWQPLPQPLLHFQASVLPNMWMMKSQLSPKHHRVVINIVQNRQTIKSR